MCQGCACEAAIELNPRGVEIGAGPPLVHGRALRFVAIGADFVDVLIEACDGCLVHIAAHEGGAKVTFFFFWELRVDLSYFAIDFSALLRHRIPCLPSPFRPGPCSSRRPETKVFKSLVGHLHDVQDWFPLLVYSEVVVDSHSVPEDALDEEADGPSWSY